jgi:hypothetical protein
MVVFYLCALWNIHVFLDAMLMCPMMLKHLICLNVVSANEVLPVACLWSVILMVVCTFFGLLVLYILFGQYGIMLIYGLLVPPEVYMHEELRKTYRILDQSRIQKRRDIQDFVCQRRKGKTYDNPDICR